MTAPYRGQEELVPFFSRLPGRLVDRIDAKAQAEERTIQVVVRRLLEAALDREDQVQQLHNDLATIGQAGRLAED